MCGGIAIFPFLSYKEFLDPSSLGSGNYYLTFLHPVPHGAGSDYPICDFTFQLSISFSCQIATKHLEHAL